MAASVWAFLAAFAVPAPLFLLVLLNLPLPRPIRRGILAFVSNVFELPLVGLFKTLHVMLFLLAVTFGSAVRTLALVQQAQAPAAQYATATYEVVHLSKKWRAERNLWLSGFAFTLWATLAAFYREASRRATLEDRLVEYEMSEYTATADTARDASVSKEVSSRPGTGGATPRGASASPSKLPPPAKPEPSGSAIAAGPAPVRKPPGEAEHAPRAAAAVEMAPIPVGPLVKKDL